MFLSSFRTLSCFTFMVLEIEPRVTIKAVNVLPQTSCSYCGLEWLELNPTFVQGTLFTDQNAIYISCDPPFINMFGTCEFYCAGYYARFQSQNPNNQWTLPVSRDPGVREALKPITGNNEMCLWWLRKHRVQHQYGLALGALEGCGALFKSPMGGFLF